MCWRRFGIRGGVISLATFIIPWSLLKNENNDRIATTWRAMLDSPKPDVRKYATKSEMVVAPILSKVILCALRKLLNLSRSLRYAETEFLVSPRSTAQWLRKIWMSS